MWFIATPITEQLRPESDVVGWGEGKAESLKNVPILPLDICRAACSSVTPESLWWNHRHSTAAEVCHVRTEPCERLRVLSLHPSSA